MKKSFFLLCALLSVFLISCSSVPKTVKSGDSIAIGRIEANLHDYRPFEDVEFKGRKTDGLELTFVDLDASKILHVKPNRDGFLMIKNFIPEHRYVADSMKITVTGTSGSQVSLTINFTAKKPFTLYENKVLNLGDVIVDCNGANNSCMLKVNSFVFARQYFKDLCEEEESEWYDVEIVNDPLFE